MKKKKREKVLYILLLLLFGGIFLFSAGKLIKNLSDKRQEVLVQEDLTDRFLTPVPETAASDGTAASTEETTGQRETDDLLATGGTLSPSDTTAPDTRTASEEPSEPSESLVSGEVSLSIWPQFGIDWRALQQTNDDVVGWIWIYDTTVNYPVLQGTDNGTYLYSTIDKTYARSGSIFMDYRVNGDFSSKNTLIYGHNYMGLKFHALMDYRKQSFYDAHKYICLFTPAEGLQKYIIYSAYVTDIYSDAFTVRFADEAAYAAFLRSTVDASGVQTGIVPTVDDNVITLSTCTNNGADQRFVVHAILWNGED